MPKYHIQNALLTLCPLGNCACFLSSADFFKINFFEKKNSGIPSERQTVWILVRPNISWTCLGPNCMQRLSTDDTTPKESSNAYTFFGHSFFENLHFELKNILDDEGSGEPVQISLR